MSVEGHSLWQEPPLGYGAEMSEKRHESLSGDRDSQGKAGNVGLLERTVAFMRLLIFPTKAQKGNRNAIMKKAAPKRIGSGAWDCAPGGQLGHTGESPCDSEILC